MPEAIPLLTVGRSACRLGWCRPRPAPLQVAPEAIRTRHGLRRTGSGGAGRAGAVSGRPGVRAHGWPFYGLAPDPAGRQPRDPAACAPCLRVPVPVLSW